LEQRYASFSIISFQQIAGPLSTSSRQSRSDFNPTGMGYAWLSVNNLAYGEVETATRFPLLHTPDCGYLNQGLLL
jgi:hypothetical protein